MREKRRSLWLRKGKFLQSNACPILKNSQSWHFLPGTETPAISLNLWSRVKSCEVWKKSHKLLQRSRLKKSTTAKKTRWSLKPRLSWGAYSTQGHALLTKKNSWRKWRRSRSWSKKGIGLFPLPLSSELDRKRSKRNLNSRKQRWKPR